MVKVVIATFILFSSFMYNGHCSCGGATLSIDASELAKDNLVTTFIPDIHITGQYQEDLKLIEPMRNLYFEADKTENPRNDVYARSVRNYGGQEVMLLTDDNMRISCLYFKRPQATVNLIYVPGYFFDLTPSKEWGAPFSILFDTANVLILDWRGTGHSDGVSGFLRKNSFGANAYPDIQATIEFMHKENNLPTVLIGFCFGAAMIMHATIQAQKEGKKTADALVLNCVFTKAENQFNRAAQAEDRLAYRLLLDSGIARILLDWQCDGDLFTLNPIEMIRDIKIPVYFEHYSYDPFATLHEGIEIFNAATCPKMFMRSDVGRHVRIHTKVPYQYRNAFFTFLNKHVVR